jgi:hypothetical protein
MSTKNIIKLAEKFEKKYQLSSFADSYLEASRIKELISNRFPDLLKSLREYQTAVTLTLKYDSEFFTGGKIVVDKAVWAANTDQKVQNYFNSIINRTVIPFLNTMNMNFSDSPWDVTLP